MILEIACMDFLPSKYKKLTYSQRTHKDQKSKARAIFQKNQIHTLNRIKLVKLPKSWGNCLISLFCILNLQFMLPSYSPLNSPNSLMMSGSPCLSSNLCQPRRSNLDFCWLLTSKCCSPVKLLRVSGRQVSRLYVNLEL